MVLCDSEGITRPGLEIPAPPGLSILETYVSSLPYGILGKNVNRVPCVLCYLMLSYLHSLDQLHYYECLWYLRFPFNKVPLLLNTTESFHGSQISKSGVFCTFFFLLLVCGVAEVCIRENN